MFPGISVAGAAQQSVRTQSLFGFVALPSCSATGLEAKVVSLMVRCLGLVESL
jgi:hypothetical protein